MRLPVALRVKETQAQPVLPSSLLYLQGIADCLLAVLVS